MLPGCEGGFPYLIGGKYAEDFGLVVDLSSVMLLILSFLLVSFVYLECDFLFFPLIGILPQLILKIV
jgi:hypothetical protein